MTGLQIKGNHTFEVVAPKLWNFLPLDLQSVDTFKKQLQIHLLRLVFP